MAPRYNSQDLLVYFYSATLLIVKHLGFKLGNGLKQKFKTQLQAEVKSHPMGTHEAQQYGNTNGGYIQQHYLFTTGTLICICMPTLKVVQSTLNSFSNICHVNYVS